MKPFRSILLFSLLAALPAALLSGYGSDEKKAAPAAASKPTANIVGVAVENGSFKTLVAAVQAAGLVETLSGEGPFTVFAPTDAAFAALPAGTVESLLKPENKDTLINILTYHVVAGNVPSSAVSTGKVKAVNGAELSIVAGASGVQVNGANVVIADVFASNGVIHVVDKVILPPSM